MPISMRWLDANSMLTFPIDPVKAPKTPEEFRREISNLFTSYHAADVDLLKEIVQNAVDALEDRFSVGNSTAVPMIQIELDLGKGIVVICDNGPGIPDDKIEKLGRPINTNKTGRRKRGHKGVGLSYAAWSSLLLRFATKREGEKSLTAGRLADAAVWLNGATSSYPRIEEDPTFTPEFLKQSATGTVFEFHLGPEHALIRFLRKLKPEGLEFFLRTATAIGYLDLSQDSEKSYPGWVQKTQVLVDVDGKMRTLEMGYLLPHQHFGKAALDLSKLQSLSVDKIDQIMGTKKCIHHKLSNKQILDILSKEEDESLAQLAEQQEVKAYGAFLDSATTFRTWNESLYRPKAGPGRRRTLVEAGVHFVTVTMPAGDVRDIKLTFGTGNKDRLFLIVQFKDVAPDTGRKVFERRVEEIGQQIAAHMVGEFFVPNRKVLETDDKPHGSTESEQAMSLESAKEQASAKVDLLVQNIPFVKEPTSEQDVVALFATLCGAGYLPGFRLFGVNGSHAKYDSFYRYLLMEDENADLQIQQFSLPPGSFGKKNKVEFPLQVMEFKLKLSSLILDFECDGKSFEEIALAVAWDVGDNDAFAGSSDYRLEEVGPSTKMKQYAGETHLIRATGMSKKIHVILLKHVIQAISDHIAE